MQYSISPFRICDFTFSMSIFVLVRFLGGLIICVFSDFCVVGIHVIPVSGCKNMVFQATLQYKVL